MREVDRVKPTAKFVGISEWKIRDMANKGEIPHFRAGRILLFRRSSIINWMNNLEAKSVLKSKKVEH